MGLRDRKYMHEQPSDEEGRSMGHYLLRLVTVFLGLYLVFFAVRSPVPILFKIPLLVGLGFFLRYLWRLPLRMTRDSFLEQGQEAERQQNFMKAAYHYERALEVDRDNLTTAIRLLAAYEASDQVKKSCRLIGALEGRIIPERQVEEFEHLVSRYQMVTLEKTDAGCRVRLKEE